MTEDEHERLVRVEEAVKHMSNGLDEFKDKTDKRLTSIDQNVSALREDKARRNGVLAALAAVWGVAVVLLSNAREWLPGGGS